MVAGFFALLLASLAGPVADTGVCDADDPLPYYAIDLVTTKRVPGSRLATGRVDVTYARSPFGISISPAGTYTYDLALQINRLAPTTSGTYIAWIATPSLGEVRRLGPLSKDHGISGQVDWNKFLIFVTLEPSDDPTDTRWTGPVVVRGMSRSGLMHTMAGHGPYQQEPCAAYGFR